MHSLAFLGSELLSSGATSAAVSEEADTPQAASTPSKYNGQKPRKQHNLVRFEDTGELSTNVSVLFSLTCYHPRLRAFHFCETF
jgi:hypothetical protein